MAESLLIRKVRVLDPGTGLDLKDGSVLVQAGRIKAVGKQVSSSAGQQIDGSGHILTPGFIDLHTHLREPGLEYKETIESGTLAAARGGFTTLCSMPNTEPPIDNRGAVEFIQREAATRGAVRVLPIACVTKGRSGRQLTEMGELADAGCVGFSDDGSPVEDSAIMRRALEYAGGLDLSVIDHCEDPALAGGVMHEGWVSTRLGLPGIPAASEESMIARDLALAKQTGSRLHIAHVSTAGGVKLIREAKADGVRVTAEVTPHHLALTHEEVMHPAGGLGLVYEPNAKMYPPLRDAKDATACVEGLRDGTVDAVATDHAPHAVQEKLVEFDDAALGITMLETAFSLSLTRVEAGELTLERLVEALTAGPVRALGLDRLVPGIGSLTEGAPADLTLIDPSATWIVDPDQFASRGKNTPLAGRALAGRVVATVSAGRFAFRDDSFGAGA